MEEDLEVVESFNVGKNPMPKRGDGSIIGPKIDLLSFGMAISNRIMARLPSTKVCILMRGFSKVLNALLV